MSDDVISKLSRALARIQEGLLPLERAFGAEPPPTPTPETKLTVVLRERRRK